MLGDAGAVYFDQGALHYGNPADCPPAARATIAESSLFGEHYLTAASLPELPLASIQGIPLLYGEPEFSRRGEVLVIHADLVASAFFLLSRYEECVLREVRDGHGRFPGRRSLLFRADVLDRPLVDEYGVALRTWLRDAGLDIPEWARNPSVVLTHDIDDIRLFTGWKGIFRSLASAALKPRRGKLRDSIDRLQVQLGNRCDPLGDPNTILRMDQEVVRQLGHEHCRVIHFMISGGDSTWDRRYDIESPEARDMVGRL